MMEEKQIRKRCSKPLSRQDLAQELRSNRGAMNLSDSVNVVNGTFEVVIC